MRFKITSLDGGCAYLSILPFVEGHADGPLQVGLNLSKHSNSFQSASGEDTCSRKCWRFLSCYVCHTRAELDTECLAGPELVQTILLLRWTHVAEGAYVFHEGLELWTGVVAAKRAIAVIALPCVEHIGLILIPAHAKLHDAAAPHLLLALRKVHDISAHLLYHLDLHHMVERLVWPSDPSSLPFSIPDEKGCK